MKVTVKISKMSSWEEFILPTKIALSTQGKLKSLNKGQLQILVPIGNLIRNNEVIRDRLDEIRAYARDSVKLIQSSVVLEEKLEKAHYIKKILEKSVQGIKDRELLHMEIAELCKKRSEEVNFRHHGFIKTISPLAVCTNGLQNRGIKRGRDE